MNWIFCALRAGWLSVFLSGNMVPLFAQEFWLRPDKYFFEPGDEAAIQIQRGENFIGEPIPIDKEEIMVLENWNRYGSFDISGRYQKNDKALIPVRLEHQGYQFVFLKTNQSYELNGESFDDYLKQYSLDEHIADRENSGRLSQSANLSLTHHIQLSLRAGKHGGAGWNKPLALPIEVIPDKNPQVLRRGDRIHFTVLENGKPAFGVRVKIWNRWDNRTTIQNIYTEQDGTVSTTISNPGDWMVTVVKLSKGANENEYIGESFCLLFGYR